MQGAQVQSLAGKLQSRMLQVQKRKGNFKKEEEEKERKKKKLSLESRTLQTRTHTPSLPTLILGVWHGCRVFSGLLDTPSLFKQPGSVCLLISMVGKAATANCSTNRTLKQLIKFF